MAFYPAVAASTVGVILAYVIAAERGDPQLERGRKWIERHRAEVSRRPY